MGLRKYLEGLVLGGDIDSGGNSINNVEQLNLEHYTLLSESFDVDDNSVETSNAANVIIVDGGGQKKGAFLLEFNDIETMAILPDATNQGNSTTLNGTTGPDGTLNISNDSGTVYYENRTGSTINITLLRIV